MGSTGEYVASQMVTDGKLTFGNLAVIKFLAESIGLNEKFRIVVEHNPETQRSQIQIIKFATEPNPQECPGTHEAVVP